MSRVLVVDDHAVIRRGVQSILNSFPEWQICGEAANGQEAVDKARKLRPDLVILDINMPILNGLAAARAILRDHPETKVLIFTVHDSEQTVREIKAAGAHGYLSKSNLGDDLVRVVRDLLNAKGRATAAAPN